VVDAEIHPNVIKEDCVVLDFGTSSLIHGSLDVDVDLEKAKQPKKKAESRFQKECPSCSMLVPSASNSCPICDYEFEKAEADSSKGELSGFVMSEIDLLTQRSNFEWCDIFGDGAALMASGFNAFAGIFFLNDHWYSIGGTEFGIKILSTGSQEICLAGADDFLNENETADNAHKSKSWLKQTASTRQLQCLPLAYRNDYSITKYKAANLLKFYFNKASIQKLLFEADAKRHVANVMGGHA